MTPDLGFLESKSENELISHSLLSHLIVLKAVILPKKPRSVFTLFLVTTSGPHHAFCFLPSLIHQILAKFSARFKLNDSTWMRLFVPQSVLKSVWADLTKLTSFMPRYVWFDRAVVSFSQKASEDDNYYDKPSLLLASDPQGWLKAYWCCRLRQQSTNPSSHCVWVSFAWTRAPPFCTICASCSVLCEHKSINKQR